MNLKEMREKRTEDLNLLLAATREKAFRLGCVSEKLTSQKGAELRVLRRDCAQLQTLVRQRELEGEVPARMGEIDKALASMNAGATACSRKRRNASLKSQKHKLQRVSRELARTKKD